MPVSIQAFVSAMQSAQLTVRAQTISRNDNGTLYWDVFFPRQDVPSILIRDILTLDDRVVADRRAWNGQRRELPLISPGFRDIEISPIESGYKILEREMQLLSDAAFGNSAIIEQIIGRRLPERTDKAAQANYRRLEIDAMNAWQNGIVVVRNPQDSQKTYTVSFGFAASRITTAPTAWNDVSVNAYNLFQAWLAAGVDAIGAIEGVQMRLATLNAILADAPDLIGGAQMTRTQLADRVGQDFGSPFYFLTNENSLDVPDDGGITTTRTKVWTAGKVAAIPLGGSIGRTAFAPVVRAGDLAASIPQSGIDTNGMTAYLTSENAGRGLSLDVQVNALSIPDESRVWVIGVGV